MTSRIAMFGGGRGRPRGKFSPDHSNFMSMLLIAIKHNLEPKRLVDAFFKALENGSSHCGGLTISCRAANQSPTVFLITKGENVVWQSSISLKGIRSSDARDYIQSIKLPEKVKKKTYEKNQNIGELRFGMKGVTVNGKIVEIPPAQDVITRSGEQACVSNVKIADKTGSTRLGLWNKQIKWVNLGDKIKIKNCSVYRFAGKLRLRLGRKGSISVMRHSKKTS